MLGGSVPGLLASSGDNTAAAAASAHEGGGGELGVGGVIVSNSASISLFGDELQDKGDRSLGGNRWPRQETLALLKIRSDMDVVFRDSSLKGPLWDDVSRKMAELGFHRSAKKCKEKFENVYKYHKRTKDGRATKQDGKSYRFFDQLEALDHHHSSLLPSLPPPPPPPPTTPKPQVPPAVVASTTMAATMPAVVPTIISHVTVPSTTNPTVASMSLNNSTITPLPSITNPTISFPPAAAAIPITQTSIPSSSLPNMHANLMSNYTSSSSTSSDEQFVQGRNKRKRKWKEFFERLMNEVVEKQEKLQKRFLEAIEKREHDRMVREESWKMQEMARMNREHEILVQERSMAVAKDAAVIAFLQKISEQQTVQAQAQAQPTPVAQAQIVLNENTTSVMSRQPPKHQPQPQQQQQQITPPPLPLPPPQAKVIKDIVKFDNGGGKIPSPSRWPKAEVQALINLRTSLDLKYQENGPKGPLWEDISSGMSKIGYNRSAKRCKEKWENINKYFKKVKESNKRRPEDSKTCPYFHLLDALYKEKNKYDPTPPPSYSVKPDDQNPMAALPLMVQPEQQWPQQRHLEEDGDENDNMGQNQEEEEEEDGDEDDDLDDDDDEDDEGGGGYEIVSNKPANYNTVSNVE